MMVVFFRPNLNVTTGAGRLIQLQVAGLREAGVEVDMRCERGAFRFLLQSGIWACHATRGTLAALASSPNNLLVDHGMRLPNADIVFVHNLLTEAVRYLPRDDWNEGARDEARFFGELNPAALVVANSNQVRRSIVEHFAIDPVRVVVELPGFQGSRFNLARGKVLRIEGRKKLGLGDEVPLVGFVTSGDFRKRGLDVFLKAAEIIAEAVPTARFLVVGSRRLPETVRRHPLVAERRLLHVPKSRRPDPWFAALDVFLYPALFEEFGLVVSEALALGIPVLTSKRVGASECLPHDYAPWLIDEPDADVFAELTLRLLADRNVRRQLGEAGARGIAPFEAGRYVRATVALILRSERKEGALPAGPGLRTDSSDKR